MVEQEARALDELDTHLEAPSDLALMTDVDFSLGSELESWQARAPPDLAEAVGGRPNSSLGLVR